jgi:putative transposase
MLFATLAQARVALSIWHADDNGARPHPKLNWQTPSAFASPFHLLCDLELGSARVSSSGPDAHSNANPQSNRQSELGAGQ